MILVISWGGFRGFYALGILKAIEELNLQNKFKWFFGVSAGAILLAWWLSGHKADQIFKVLINLNYLSYLKPSLKIHKSLVNTDKIEKLFSQHFKKDFASLQAPLWVGTTDLLEWKYFLFNKGPLLPLVLWSMSLPGIFPGVEYDWKFLVDGWVINNFPTNHAKSMFPNEKIIWISINFVWKINKISNIFENIYRSWTLTLAASTITHKQYVDILLEAPINIKILEISKNKFKQAFEKWYKDWLKYLSI